MPNLEEYTRVWTSKSRKKVLVIRFYWMSHSFGGYEHFLVLITVDSISMIFQLTCDTEIVKKKVLYTAA
jgi:hypothetical protein